MMKNIRPIRNESDYNWALEEIGTYFEDQPAPGTADADRFDIFACLIEVYEDNNWAIKAPTPG